MIKSDLFKLIKNSFIKNALFNYDVKDNDLSNNNCVYIINSIYVIYMYLEFDCYENGVPRFCVINFMEMTPLPVEINFHSFLLIMDEVLPRHNVDHDIYYLHFSFDSFYEEKRSMIINEGINLLEYENKLKKEVTIVFFKYLGEKIIYFYGITSKDDVNAFARNKVKNELISKIKDEFLVENDDIFGDFYFYVKKIKVIDDREAKKYAEKEIELLSNGTIVQFSPITDTYTNSIWKSEFELYLRVKRLYQRYNVFYQYRVPNTNQHYDIFIKELKIAIEYQGKQHYEAIEYFGGKEALEKNVERDSNKKRESLLNGIYIVYFKYDKKITDEIVKNKVSYQIKKREKRFNLDYETAFNEKKQIEERKEREKKEAIKRQKKIKLEENIKLANNLYP